MKTTIVLLCAVLGSMLFFTSCPMNPGGTNGADPFVASGDLTGTITVAHSAYWSRVALGLFYSSNEASDDSHHLTTVDDGAARRLSYQKDEDGSDVQFAPVVRAPIYNNLGSLTKRSFGFDIPPEPVTGDYYLVAWYDANQDSKLGLRDSSDEATIAEGEFNRLAFFIEDSTVYWMSRIHYEPAISPPTFKYDAYPLGGAPRFFDVDDSEHEFSFEITAASGF